MGDFSRFKNTWLAKIHLPKGFFKKTDQQLLQLIFKSDFNENVWSSEWLVIYPYGYNFKTHHVADFAAQSCRQRSPHRRL